MKMMLSYLQVIILFLAFSSLHAMTRNPCKGTLHPDLFVSMLPTFSTNQSLPEIISSTIKHTLFQVQESYKNIRMGAQNVDQHRTLSDCHELLELTTTHLNTSIHRLLDPNGVQDVQLLLSAASTNLYTCLDGLAQSKNLNEDHLEESLINISNQINNALAMAARLPAAHNSSSEYVYSMSDDGYPAWMEEETISELDEYDLVVAQDGSGNFKTINEALNAAPNESPKRFVIHIKAGTYFENVEVTVEKKNITLVGDGMDKTWIKGNRNVADGWTSYNCAVLAVVGEGFIAKNIAVDNYAGPTKNQAVALRTNADRSAFFRCSFIGYQDTLYVYSFRQFFRECDIYGTVDMIFGNSAALLQNCNLYARNPLPYQKNVFTAQGRTCPDQPTGISIIESKIEASSEWSGSIESYLGRPWKEYSRTVIIRSQIGDLIDPAGWLEYNGSVGLKTLYYGEYMNKGSGADTDRRVRWPGYKVITDRREAAHFTARAFIQGATWLEQTTIPYYLGFPRN